MRLRIVLGLFTVSLLICLVGPDGFGQQGKGKGKGSFGAAPDAAPGAAPVRKGVDSGKFFDAMAKGNPYITIDDLPTRMQEPLAKFAQEQGIPNGQITREQWTQYTDAKAKAGPGGQPRPAVVGDVGSAGGPPPGATAELVRLWADTEFRRLDENGDGKLNEDEMPAALRKELALWDKNGDGLIDQDEYRTYFTERFEERIASSAKNKQNPNSLADDELDARPTVYRAGKLPAKGLPPWFKQLDTDGDGQVALYEWRQAGKNLDEFKFWDRDDDGFITPEEALHINAALLKTQDPLLASADSTPGSLAGPGGNPFGNKGPGGPKGKGNFGGGFGGQGGPGGIQFQGFGGGKGKGGAGGQFPGFGNGGQGGGWQMGNTQGGGQPGGGWQGNPQGGGKGKGKKGGGNTPPDGN